MFLFHSPKIHTHNLCIYKKKLKFIMKNKIVTVKFPCNALEIYTPMQHNNNRWSAIKIDEFLCWWWFFQKNHPLNAVIKLRNAKNHKKNIKMKKSFRTLWNDVDDENCFLINSTTRCFLLFLQFINNYMWKKNMR